LRKINYKDWLLEAEVKFGKETKNWKFICPACGYITSVEDWKNAGATEGEYAFSCIGRNIDMSKNMGTKPGPCNYAGGGLIRMNPVHVYLKDGHIRETFEFAEVNNEKKPT